MELPGGVQQGARSALGRFAPAELRMPVPTAGEGRPGKHLSSRGDQRVTWAHGAVEAQAGSRCCGSAGGGGADGSIYPGQAEISCHLG